jgi:dTDP-4-amino-4,6-dideoxygalactose transaminase
MIPVTQPILPELKKYVQYLERIWQTKWVTNNGEFALLLEKKLKDYLKVENLVLVSNGTLALQLALKAFNLRGEVITTPFTFVATTNAVRWEGLTPVFADIDPETFNIDPKDVEEKITEKTCAILAVHVYGNPCRVDELSKIAHDHDLKLIYDAAHCFGVEYNNQSVFSYGDVSALSFHATKVFNTIEGGALVTKDRKLAEKLRLLRDHGIKSAEEFIGIGTNAKMNEFQAAMGLCNLENVDLCIESRKRLYECYVDKLGKQKKHRFQKLEASKYNYAYMPVIFSSRKERDDVYNELLKHGVQSRKYFYPLTVNSSNFNEEGSLVKKFNLVTASDIAQRVLCLPLYPELPIEEVHRIVEIVELLAH